ncbi:hypothetical protein BX600DRAFT_276945 [Xylariales sp. PMI_506]|nr:hypothetical protein BX600DRAFT_276945 [Xylariales sp. PMI_506]
MGVALFIIIFFSFHFLHTGVLHCKSVSKALSHHGEGWPGRGSPAPAGMIMISITAAACLNHPTRFGAWTLFDSDPFLSGQRQFLSAPYQNNVGFSEHMPCGGGPRITNRTVGLPRCLSTPTKHVTALRENVPKLWHHEVKMNGVKSPHLCSLLCGFDYINLKKEDIKTKLKNTNLSN